MQYSLIHTYGVTRSEYYKATGIDRVELARHLEAEVEVMEAHLLQVRRWFRKRPYASPVGRYLAGLIKHIDRKVELKHAKIKSIRAE